MIKIVVILGSSRSQGNTRKILDQFTKDTDWPIEDLKNYNISYFDYEHLNKTDDYIPLMTRLIQNYDLFVFATPVYWYTMSGVMKVFFDRITDLLTIEKDLGRKLRGKTMAVISCSNADDRDSSFIKAFKESADYLGMSYFGDLHTWIKDKDIESEVIDRINIFREKLLGL